MQLFYVGVYCNERVHFGCYGFTSYVDCYVEAETSTEASKLAKEYFETRYKVTVNGTRPQKAKEQNKERYAFPEQIISCLKPMKQTLLKF